MATLLAFKDAVPLGPDGRGRDRGRAAAEAAASIHRIDRQLGRPADVNEAWRSPAQADENHRKWVAYQNGTGPVAPYALPAKDSIHCRGYAADSDDWYDAAAAAVWRDNGWRQTARYPGTSRDEPWHGEYFRHLDNHYGQVAGGGAVDFTPTVSQEGDMRTIRWNQTHVFTIGPEQVTHIDTATKAYLAAAIHNPDRKFVDVDNEGLTAALETFGVPWYAVDAAMRKQALTIEGGNGGRYWSRALEIKADVRIARDTLASSIAELEKTAADTGGIAGLES